MRCVAVVSRAVIVEVFVHLRARGQREHAEAYKKVAHQSITVTEACPYRPHRTRSAQRAGYRWFHDVLFAPLRATPGRA